MGNIQVNMRAALRETRALAACAVELPQRRETQGARQLQPAEQIGSWPKRG
jgi:hypothetical protein